MKNKLVIYSPFNSLFGDNIWGVITRKPNPGRDKVIFVKDLLTFENVFIYNDELYNNSSADFINRIPFLFLRKILIKLELYLWCRYYQIQYTKVKVINSIFDIDYKDLVLVSLHYLPKKNSLEKTNATKLIYASHFFYNIKENCKKIKKLNNIYFLAEADITKNSIFFRKFFGHNFQTYILPFQLKKRFIKSSGWDERSPKCLALGTTHELPYTSQTKEFIDFYGKNTWHYMREDLYLAKNKLNELMNIKIERFNEDLKISKIKTINYLQNIFLLGRQKKYFSFDIVEAFNNHKIFISPEERVGLPSINFVEGMSCGCAYIGIDSQIYKDLGLVKEKHFISYDGTMNDLISKLNYYSNNDNLLRDIAENGYNFVISNFNKNVVKKVFLNDIDIFYNTGNLTSSFLKNQ